MPLGSQRGRPAPTLCRECKKLHLAAEFAVVAFLGFLEQSEVLVEHLLLGECDAVDAHELVALLVTAPVGSGERGDLDSFDGGCGGDVRATTEVGKASLGIGCDGAVLKLGDELALVFLASVAEELHSVLLLDVGTDYGLLLTGEFEHFLFDFSEIGRCDGVFSRVDIVVEAVLYGGTYAEFHAGIQFLEGFSKKVGR